ncbi:MAG: lytic transglycosylase domain-containing protein, partial [Myxococcota bacterium]
TGSAFAFGVRGAPEVHASALVTEHDLVVERTARMADSEWVRNALLQTERIEKVVAALEKRNMPTDLAGIPLAESGFQNLGVGPKPIYTAGMWQFIPATAKNYGLVVDDNVDERQDIDKATDAALNLLQDLHDEFGDWKLAVVAYNTGAKPLHKAIKAEGTRDVMVLVERGAVPKYVLNVMASAVLLRDAGMLKSLPAHAPN